MATIQKVNEFLGTGRSPELIQQIADVTTFSKMKEGKMESMESETIRQQVCFSHFKKNNVVCNFLSLIRAFNHSVYVCLNLKSLN